MKYFIITFLLITTISPCWAQEDSSAVERPAVLRVNGYVKNLNGMMFFSKDATVQWGILHNRINVKYMPKSWLTGALELRNRIVYGEAVSSLLYISSQLGYDRGLADLTFVPFDSRSVIMSSAVERMWLRAEFGKFEVTAGRQRINWGLNLVWNPLDVFNTYSFVDFDYEERPGSDAIRIKMNTGELSSVELAAKSGRYENDDVYAMRYKFNRAGYDFQFIAGRYEGDWMAGTGWAGSLGNVGFKSELSYFQNSGVNHDSSSVLAASTEFDYTINGKLYLNLSYLYNSNGKNSIEQGSVNLLNANELIGPKQLSPSKHSAFLQLSSISSPVLTASVSAIYFFGINGLYVFPSMSYSINDNWEAAMFLQSYWLDEGKFKGKLNNVMIRMKYSF